MPSHPRAPVETRPSRTSEATFERGRRRRTQIVEVATEMFAREGYRGTSLAAIAEACGISVPTLLHHMGSKDALLQAVHERWTAQDREYFEQLREAGTSFFDIVAGHGAHVVARPGLIELHTVLVAENLRPEHPGHEFFLRRYRLARAFVAGMLELEQGRGRIRPDVQPDDVAPRVLAMMDGLQLQWLLDRAGVDLEHLFRDYAEALRQELGPRS